MGSFQIGAKMLLGDSSPLNFLYSDHLFSSVPPIVIHSGNCSAETVFPLTSHFSMHEIRLFEPETLNIILFVGLSIWKNFSITAFPYHSSNLGLGVFAFTSVEIQLIRTWLIYCGTTVVAFEHARPCTVSVPCWRSHIVYKGTIF